MTFDYDKFAQAITKANKTESKKEEAEQYFKNGRDLIEGEKGWFKKRKYKIDDLLFQPLNEKGEAINNLKADLADFLDSIPKKHRKYIPNRGELLDIVSFMREEKKIEKWNEISKLFYVGNFDSNHRNAHMIDLAYDEIRKLVKILVPERNVSQESDRPEFDDEPERMRYTFLFKNFFQQFKHFEIKKEVHPFPIIPIFFGGEGLGKTKFVDKISSIFKPFVVRGSFQAITEPEKYYKLLCDNRLLICEEMVGVQKSDMESFKSTSTASYLDVRPMYTQDNDKHRIRAPIIGNTNKPMWEVMRSYGGKNRRFGNIFVRNDIDLNALDDINFLAIVQGIPLCDVEGEIVNSKVHYQIYVEPYQIETQNLDEFEQWVEARGLVRQKDNSKNRFVSFDKFFDDFKEYWNSKGGYPRYYTKKFLKNKIKIHFGIDCRPETDYPMNGERGLKVDTSKHSFGFHSQLTNGTVIPLKAQSKL